ncbi:MAG: extracellular matrix regulator RemB [Angelakisella sp.]
MYLHLGQETVVRERDIIGIFDLDNTTVSRHTRKTLNEAEKAGRVINVTDDLPKDLCHHHPARQKTGEDMVYLCQLSTGTLKKRSGR